MPFKYTVVTDTMPWIGYDILEQPQEVLSAVKEAGYDGIDLPGDPTRMNGSEWRKMTEDAGLVVPEILGAWGYYHAREERNLASPDQAKRNYAVTYARNTIDLAAEIGASMMELCAAQPMLYQLPFPDDDIAVMRENFKKSICEICAHAAACGITVLLEPLNCYEGLPGVLTTVIEAVNFVEELQLDNLGVQPDNYHMNIGETSIVQAIRRAGKHIKHYHFNETNHRMHGTGHADYREIVRTLKDLDYEGYLAFYMPQTSQQIFKSTAGTGPHTPMNVMPRPAGGRTLLEYLQQPLNLLKTLEHAVDIERDV